LEFRNWSYEQFEDFTFRWAVVGFNSTELKKIRKEQKRRKFRILFAPKKQKRSRRTPMQKQAMELKLKVRVYQQKLSAFKSDLQVVPHSLALFDIDGDIRTTNKSSARAAFSSFVSSEPFTASVEKISYIKQALFQRLAIVF